MPDGQLIMLVELCKHHVCSWMRWLYFNAGNGVFALCCLSFAQSAFIQVWLGAT